MEISTGEGGGVEQMVFHVFLLGFSRVISKYIRNILDKYIRNILELFQN